MPYEQFSIIVSNDKILIIIVVFFSKIPIKFRSVFYHQDNKI